MVTALTFVGLGTVLGFFLVRSIAVISNVGCFLYCVDIFTEKGGECGT